MIKTIGKNRYLVARRVVQAGLMILFAGANYFGWKVLMGNYSSARVFDLFYLADPYAVLQILAAGFLLNVDVLIGAVIILLFYSLVGGRSFCSWVCPMNVVTDFALWIRRRTGMNKVEGKIPLNRNLRYWIMAMGLIMSVWMGFAAFEFISPIGMLHRGVIFGMGFGLAAVIAIFFFDLFVVRNGWCGYLCPLGGFYSTIGKYSLFRVNHQQQKCTACNDCFGVCPEKQVLSIINKESGSILFGACNNCGRCIEACNDGALKFGVIKRKNKSKL